MLPENTASIGNQLKTGFACFYEEMKYVMQIFMKTGCIVR